MMQTTAMTVMTEEGAEGAEGAVLEAGALAQGKCTRQLARTAGRNAKCLSSLLKEGPFIAGIVTKNTKSSRET